MLQIINESKKYDGNAERSYYSFTLQLINCTMYKSDLFKIRKRIVSEYFTVLAVLKGVLRFDTGECVKRGSVLFLPIFSNVNIETENHTEFIQVNFSCSGLKPYFPRSPKVLDVEMDVFKGIERLYRIATFHSTIEGVKEAILLDIINGLCKYFSATSRDVSLYQKTCRWIEANSEKDISAQDVAEALGYSREHLNRIIKSIDNESLTDKIVKHRIENIKMLCKADSVSVAEIADRLGFYSRELLCKYFKYHTGVSINKYRDLLRSP